MRLNETMDFSKENEVINEILGIEKSKTKIMNIDSSFDEQQSKAYNMMGNFKNNLFISGKAGTVKSFLLRLFSKGTSKNHLIVAQKGISVLNV